MSRSATTAQINTLGDRLRRSERPSAADLERLQRVRADYDAPLVRVEEGLRSLGLRPTSRLKTVGTIVDKLKRERTRLSKMQDIAGVRVVSSGGLEEQDEVVRSISSSFLDGKIIDRRRTPNHGYRAVHVIVEEDGCPVEIQVRTKIQDEWAQLMESAADAFGRQIRYGEPPDMPEAQFRGGSRQEFVDALIAYAALDAECEEALKSHGRDAPELVDIFSRAVELMRKFEP